MVLPVTPQNVLDQYTQLRVSASNTISYMKQVQSQISGNAMSASFFLTALAAAVSTLTLASQIATAAPSGSDMGNALDGFVQQQTGQPTLSVHTELTASMSALSALITAMTGDYPKDSAGHLLDRTFDAIGNVVWSSLSAVSFTNTNTAITAWLATIQ